MLSKPLAASLPSVVDYDWLNRPRARSNLLNDRYNTETRAGGEWRGWGGGQGPQRSVRQTCARRGYKQSCFSQSWRKVSRRKFIPGISNISLYRVGDEIKRDAIKGDGGDERGAWDAGAMGSDKRTQVQRTISQRGWNGNSSAQERERDGFDLKNVNVERSNGVCYGAVLFLYLRRITLLFASWKRRCTITLLDEIEMQMMEATCSLAKEKE